MKIICVPSEVNVFVHLLNILKVVYCTHYRCKLKYFFLFERTGRRELGMELSGVKES